jgi:hypothetical protein
MRLRVAVKKDLGGNTDWLSDHQFLQEDYTVGHARTASGGLPGFLRGCKFAAA